MTLPCRLLVLIIFATSSAFAEGEDPFAEWRSKHLSKEELKAHEARQRSYEARQRSEESRKRSISRTLENDLKKMGADFTRRAKELRSDVASGVISQTSARAAAEALEASYLEERRRLALAAEHELRNPPSGAEKRLRNVISDFPFLLIFAVLSVALSSIWLALKKILTRRAGPPIGG